MVFIPVDKGVPLAPRGFDSTIFERLAVGDSFLLPANTVRDDTFRHYASMAGKRLRKQFSVRKTPNGLRCWRIT
jgi:hypothetical protein